MIMQNWKLVTYRQLTTWRQVLVRICTTLSSIGLEDLPREIADNERESREVLTAHFNNDDDDDDNVESDFHFI